MCQTHYELPYRRYYTYIQNRNYPLLDYISTHYEIKYRETKQFNKNWQNDKIIKKQHDKILQIC